MLYLQGVRGVSGRVSQRALGRRGGRQGNAQKAGKEKEKKNYGTASESSVA